MDYFICITILAALAWLAGYVLIKLYGLITNVLFGYRDEDLTRSFTRKVVKAYLIVVLVSIGAVVWDRIEMGMDFETELKGTIGDVKNLVLDFEKLEYISSAGLRVLLAAQKMIGQEGSMKLINVNEIIMEIFDVTGFTDILTIEQ